MEGDASVEDVVKSLQAQSPLQQALPAPASTDRSGPAGGHRQASLLGPAGRPAGGRREPILWAPIADGTPLSNRPGRIVQSGPWWTIVFESDHPERPQPPMRVLPNQTLEGMVKATERGTSGLVFVVSGEVTAFRGENYLLARVALRRTDLGNLSK